MDLRPYTVTVAPGDGLIARTGDVLMYVGETTGAAALLSALDSVAAAPSPGWALAKVLAGLDSEMIPPFGVVAPAGDGLLLMLRGSVAADIEADGAARTLAGDRAVTWVDEMVREPVAKLVIGGGNVSGLTAHPLTDLRAGVVPGGGFALTRAAPVPAPEPSPAVAEQLQPPTQAGSPERDQAAEPDQTALLTRPAGWSVQAPTPAPSGSGGPAEAPPRKRADPTAMAMPFTGALTADDQAVYPLDRPYVLGRDPMVDTAVRDAKASPIVLSGDPQISRVHAYVTVNEGVVLVRDARTPAGTYVAAPGDQAWTSVGDQPTELKPGWSLRIGQRILVYRNAGSAQ